MRFLLAALLAALALPAFAGSGSVMYNGGGPQALPTSPSVSGNLTLVAGSSVTSVQAGWVTQTGATLTVTGPYPMTDYPSVIMSSAPENANVTTFAVQITTGSWYLELNWAQTSVTTGTIHILVNGNSSGSHYSVGSNNMPNNGPFNTSANDFCYLADNDNSLTNYIGTINRGGSYTIHLNVGETRPSHLLMPWDGVMWNAGTSAYNKFYGGCGYTDASNATPITSISIQATKGATYKGHIRLFRSN